MRFINGTAKVLLLYLVFMLIGQAIAVGIGLALDPFSKSLALATFIPLYYAMYWVAWRAALFVGDRSPEPAAKSDRGDSAARTATWLLAPAVLALDFCD